MIPNVIESARRRAETAAMSAAANHAILRRYADLWLAGDVPNLIACYHDEMTLHWPGAHPLAGAHRGKPAALQALAALAQRANRQLLAITDVFASNTHGCMLSRERFTRDGESHDLDRTLIFAFKDGKLFECWVHDRDPALVDYLLR